MLKWIDTIVAIGVKQIVLIYWGKKSVKLSGKNYLELLEDTVDHMKRETRITNVRQFMDNEWFPGELVDKRRIIEWPPRSADLTPLDFSWGNSKLQVYTILQDPIY